jgi:hypothetical protein
VRRFLNNIDNTIIMTPQGNAETLLEIDNLIYDPSKLQEETARPNKQLNDAYDLIIKTFGDIKESNLLQIDDETYLSIAKKALLPKIEAEEFEKMTTPKHLGGYGVPEDIVITCSSLHFHFVEPAKIEPIEPIGPKKLIPFELAIKKYVRPFLVANPKCKPKELEEFLDKNYRDFLEKNKKFKPTMAKLKLAGKKLVFSKPPAPVVAPPPKVVAMPVDNIREEWEVEEEKRYKNQFSVFINDPSWASPCVSDVYGCSAKIPQQKVHVRLEHSYVENKINRKGNIITVDAKWWKDVKDSTVKLLIFNAEKKKRCQAKRLKVSQAMSLNCPVLFNDKQFVNFLCADPLYFRGYLPLTGHRTFFKGNKIKRFTGLTYGLANKTLKSYDMFDSFF